MAVKWDRTSSPDVPVSNHGLTAVCGTLTSQSGIRANLPRWMGKRYFEVTFDAGDTGVVGVSGAIPSVLFPGFGATSYGYDSNTGQKLYNTGSGYTTSAYGGSYNAGAVIGVLVDYGAGTITFYKNGVSQGTAFTSVHGALFPSVGSGSHTNQTFTANFGATPFAFAPGVGELAWDDGTPDPVVWDSLRFGANGTLSLTNHRYHIGPTSNQDNAKATFGRDSARGGKFYFEITTGAGTVSPIVGLANTNHLASQCLGFFTGSWVGIFMFSPAAYYHDGASSGGTLWLNGAWTIGVLVDFDTGQLIFRYKIPGGGSATTLPTPGFTGFKRLGTLYPTAGDGGVGAANSDLTINCGDSAFDFPMPSGYKSWDGTQENTSTDWYYGDRGANTTLGGTGVVTFNSDITAVRGIKPHWKGKYYFETTVINAGTLMIGVGNRLAALTYPGVDANGAGYFSATGNKFLGNAQTAYGASYGIGDVISVLLDIDNHTVEFWKNGVSQGVAFTFAATDFYEFLPMVGSTGFSAAQTSSNFGQASFLYTPPAGYVSWNTDDLWTRPVPLDMISETSHPPFSAAAAVEAPGTLYGYDYKVFDDAYADGDNSDIVGLQFPLTGGLGGTWAQVDFDQDEDVTYQIRRLIILFGEGGFGGLATGYQFRIEGWDGAAWQVVQSVNIATGNPVHQNLVYDVSDVTPYHKLRLVMLRGDPAPGPVQQAKIGRFIPLVLGPTPPPPDQTIEPVSIGSSEAFGTPIVGRAPVVTPSSQSAAEGFAFSYQAQATDTPTSWSATGLPTGLSINTSTGLISGTPAPASAGVYPAVVTAMNAFGSGHATVTITVSHLAPVVSSDSITAQSGDPISYQIVATNTPTGYTASGLPTGLSLNASTGVISGSVGDADVGTYHATIGATNVYGTGTAALTIQIEDAASAPFDVENNLSQVMSIDYLADTGVLASFLLKPKQRRRRVLRMEQLTDRTWTLIAQGYLTVRFRGDKITRTTKDEYFARRPRL